MFENVIRELRRLERGVTVRVTVDPIPDSDGYIERQCDSHSCSYIFKVHKGDWREFFRDEAVFCPRCRYSAPADEWSTQAQRARAAEIAKRQITGGLNAAMRRDARAINRHQQSSGFLTMHASVRDSSLSAFRLPRRISEVWKLQIRCESCLARFAVIGAAYFCPSCGISAVERVFDESLTRTEEGLENLSIIRSTFVGLALPEQGEAVVQQLLEGSVKDCVTAFQCLLHALHTRHYTDVRIPKNVFQRLSDGSAMWRSAVGVGYEEILSPDELRRLSLFFQRRHLLSHADGIVDQEYLDKSGDKAYALDQRIVVSVGEAQEMVRIIRALAQGIRNAIDGRKTA